MRTSRVLAYLGLCFVVTAGCRGGSSEQAPVPAPSLSPTPRNTTLPADWDLSFPPGSKVVAVNWRERDPGSDHVQLSVPASIDSRRFFTQALEARGHTVVDRVTDGTGHYLEAGGHSGGESFFVEITRSDVVMVSRWRPKPGAATPRP